MKGRFWPKIKDWAFNPNNQPTWRHASGHPSAVKFAPKIGSEVNAVEVEEAELHGDNLALVASSREVKDDT